MRLSHVNPRSMLAFAHDIVASGIAWLIAFWLRFNFDIPPEFAATMWKTVGAVVVLDVTYFLGFGLYRGMWRYASLHDLRLILIAVVVAATTFPAILMLVQPEFVVPRSVYILHPLLLLFFMGGSRLAYRAWNDRNIGNLGALNGKPVLILREVTERPEVVEAGIARLVGSDAEVIVREARTLLTDTAAYEKMARVENPFGDGHAGERIARLLTEG